MIQDKRVLLCFDTTGNNNKFYEMELHDSGDVHIKFGRVGAGSQSKVYSGGKRKFDSLLKEKTKKGYREVEIEETAGAVEIGAKSSPQQNVLEVALRQINYLDDGAKALVERIAKANIHNIVSNSSVQYDASTGLFKTALGVIKEGAVREAIDVLSQAEALIVDATKNEAELFRLSTEYFSRIPNVVRNAREKRYLLFSQSVIDTQKSVCSSLLDTLELVEDLKAKASAEAKQEAEENKPEEEKVFNVTISTLTDKTVYKHLEDYYHNSKKSMHSHRITSSKIRNIYTVDLADQQEPFKKKANEIGNVMQLWHGTKLANILSILSKGLVMPKDSPGAKAGAAYGLGCYFALNSSKSAGYCDGGCWSGGSGNTIYMFVADVAMGNYEVPMGYTGSGGKPSKGHDSFWVKAGQSGVQNDELVVFSLDQVKLTHVLEIEV